MSMFEMITYEQVLERLQTDGYAIGAVNPREYHKWKGMLAEALDVPVTSKSDLSDFAACPLRYRYNKENGVKKCSDALRLGSLVDCLVLTPELFTQEYLCEPKRVAITKDGKPHAKGWQDPKQKEEWEAAEAKGITVLTPEELAKAKVIAQRASEHLAERGLILGQTFQSQVAMWVCLRSVGGVPLACPVVVTGMMDILPLGGSSIWDLKTTSMPVENELKVMYTLEDFHYGVQAALYTDMYNLCTDEQRDEFSFLFTATGELPVMSREVTMQTEALEFYRAMYERWLVAFALAHATGDWGLHTLPRKFYTPSMRERKKSTQEG
ncbi:MAG: PD-(D/E)XK nuclease-like domain-containing protein [Akkermansia sp.]|nr:PD-(D/E)XK nuclease-like domain-containing protein [Akkermansia sp.]